MRVKVSPVASTAADTKVGATASVVEPFVIWASGILELSLNDASSMTLESSTLVVGSPYDSSTTAPGAIRSAIFNSTVSPLTVTDEIVLVTPPTFTVKRPVGIVPAAERTSLYVRITFVPSAFTADEL